MAQTSASSGTQPMTYPVKPIVTVSLIEGGGNVLYVKQENGPDSQSGLFLPNDMLQHGEDPYDGARRIAREQAGVDIKDPSLLHCESFEGHDGTWHLALHFRADVPNKKTGAALADNANWSSRDSLPPDSQVAHRGWYNDIAKRALKHKSS